MLWENSNEYFLLLGMDGKTFIVRFPFGYDLFEATILTYQNIYNELNPYVNVY